MNNKRIIFQNNSGSVFNGAGMLYSIFAEGNGGATSVSVYIGHNVKGRQVLHIPVSDGSIEKINFSNGIPIDNGLYIDVADSNCYVSVIYEPI